jgi:phosphatidylethanolamine/phosphatidyl-N-methylethanolamine N-methyltransferase
MSTSTTAMTSCVEHKRVSHRAGDIGLFLRQWVKAPGQMGALAPSSAHLARAVAAPIPEQGEPVVVELGPGTGALTDEIQRRLGSRGQHVAVESNLILATALQHRFRSVDVAIDDAVNLPTLLSERRIARADVVVSGLPWSLFPNDTQDRLMSAVVEVMGPHSVFTAFAYRHAAQMAAAKRFQESLTGRFEEVVLSRTVWRNLPPAFVLHVRRPRA